MGLSRDGMADSMPYSRLRTRIVIPIVVAAALVIATIMGTTYRNHLVHLEGHALGKTALVEGLWRRLLEDDAAKLLGVSVVFVGVPALTEAVRQADRRAMTQVG